MAILVLLGLLAISLSLSYATLRSQATTQQIQSNSGHRQQARVAATAGLSTGLARMHESTWAGVGTTLSGSLSGTESYSVEYQAGDPRLTPSSADYAAWPRRVTLTVTGTSVDPSQPSLQSTRQIRAIVELVPRALASVVSSWEAVSPYTVYQFGTQSFELQLPCHIEGPIRAQGSVSLASSAPSTTASRQRYLSDLNSMRAAGLGDYRPVSGPLLLPYSATSSSTRDLFTQQLGVTIGNISQDNSQSMSISANGGSYRLYPGSPLFQMTALSSSLSGVTLAPDPVTNPLGIFYRNGSLTLGDNVTIQGTLLVTGTLQVSGQNVQLQPASLVNVQGNSTAVEMPVAIADTVRLNSPATGQARGNVVCWSEFRTASGSQSLQYTINGRVVTNRFRYEAREEFSSQPWSLVYFFFQYSNDDHPYFPNYAAAFGANPVPDLTIQPDTTIRQDQYFSFTNPFYAVGSGDAGLYWNVLEIAELP